MHRLLSPVEIRLSKHKPLSFPIWTQRLTFAILRHIRKHIGRSKDEGEDRNAAALKNRSGQHSEAAQRIPVLRNKSVHQNLIETDCY